MFYTKTEKERLEEKFTGTFGIYERLTKLEAKFKVLENYLNIYYKTYPDEKIPRYAECAIPTRWESQGKEVGDGKD